MHPNKKLNEIIISVWLAIIIMTPLFVIAEHHFQAHDYHDKNILSFEISHENCLICSFNFSTLSEVSFYEKNSTLKHSGFYFEVYPYSINHSIISYSFLFRAPPAFNN